MSKFIDLYKLYLSEGKSDIVAIEAAKQDLEEERHISLLASQDGIHEALEDLNNLIDESVLTPEEKAELRAEKEKALSPEVLAAKEKEREEKKQAKLEARQARQAANRAAREQRKEENKLKRAALKEVAIAAGSNK